MIIKNTISLCPTCYQEIPASISLDTGQAVMDKKCPVHGEFLAVVEKDPDFYYYSQKVNAPAFYSGLIIDVTYRCNAKCKWCFQHLRNEDVEESRIFRLANSQPKGSHIILSGGEPTIRKDLGKIVERLSEKYCVATLTNGFQLDWNLKCNWGLSYHPETKYLFDKRVQEARELGRKFATIIYTIDNMDDYQRVLDQSFELADICEVFRIHAAASDGADCEKATQSIYVSDMYKALAARGHKVQLFPLKSIWMPLIADNVHFMLISWQTVENIDVTECRAAPWYYGHGEEIDNLVLKIIQEEREYGNNHT